MQITQTSHKPTANNTHINTENELECTLRVARNMWFSCKIESAGLLLTRLWKQPQEYCLNICVCFLHDQNDMNKTKEGLQFQYIDFTTI